MLRDEWGFDGLVMSDWFGTHSTVPAANAGLDLEMPGPPQFFGDKLAAAVRAGEVSGGGARRQGAPSAHVDRAHGPPRRRTAPKRCASTTRSIGRSCRRAAARELRAAAATSAPRSRSRPAMSTLAVIGPNADALVIQGGGSAACHSAPAGVAARRAAGAVRGVGHRGRARARLLQLQAHADAREPDRCRDRSQVQLLRRAASAPASRSTSRSPRAGCSRSSGRSATTCPSEFSLKVRGTVVAPEIGRVDVHARAGRPGASSRSTARSSSTTGNPNGRSDAFMGFGSAEASGTRSR